MQITHKQNIPFRAIIEVDVQQQWKYNCKTKSYLEYIISPTVCLNTLDISMLYQTYR